MFVVIDVLTVDSLHDGYLGILERLSSQTSHSSSFESKLRHAKDGIQIVVVAVALFVHVKAGLLCFGEIGNKSIVGFGFLQMSDDGFHDTLEDPVQVLCHVLLTSHLIIPSVVEFLLKHAPDDRGVEDVGQLLEGLLRLLPGVHLEVHSHGLLEFFMCWSSIKGILCKSTDNISDVFDTISGDITELVRDPMLQLVDVHLFGESLKQGRNNHLGLFLRMLRHAAHG